MEFPRRHSGLAASLHQEVGLAQSDSVWASFLCWQGAFEPVLSDHVDAATVEAYEAASVAWPVDPQGYHYGAGLLRLPARDLGKLGYLYLNDGRWDGNQLIRADYVAAATSLDGSSPNHD